MTSNLPTFRSPARLLNWAVCVLILVGSVRAHEVRPAYLQLHQSGPESYDAIWKVPGAGQGLRLGIYVKLPANCANVTSPRGVFGGNAFTEQWSFSCEGGLAGRSLEIDGLAATKTDTLVRIERLDGTEDVERLTPAAPSFIVQDSASAPEVARSYLLLGVEHILTGWDHLLYILGMLLLVRGWKRVVLTMSAFTLTHSITLTAAALGWVHVPSAPVEACIALSILFVASESVRGQLGGNTLARKWPWVIAFTFGLLHGFGFAGALSEVGLPQQSIPVALLLFNIGVEIGQLIFISGVFLAFTVVRQVLKGDRFSLPEWSLRIPSYGIGATAAFWFIQRVIAF